MKRFLNIAITILTLALSVLTFSCETLKDVVGTPSLSLKSINIQGLDMEGITFTAQYSVTNPYPVSCSLKQVAADVIYSDEVFTKVSTNNGVSISAHGSKTNSFNFKIPYTSILNLAKNESGKTSLPFSVKGNVSLDTSSVPLLEKSSISLPFSKSFEVPVFKPEFSVSSVKLELPTLDSLKNSLINGGMNPIKAASLAASIISGKSVAQDAFDGIDLNLKLNMNLNVANKGSSPWNFAVKNCSLDTASGAIANVTPTGNTSITASSGTIPLSATLNTLKTSAFIIQLLNKSGTNPTFNLQSTLGFTELSYGSEIPLAYSVQIPLSSVKK